MIAIGVPAEGADEPRIGLTPETVKKLFKAGAEITIRSGAGERSHFPDQDYVAAGAKIAKSDAEAVSNADIVLTVRRPDLAITKTMKKGASRWEEACLESGLAVSAFAPEQVDTHAARKSSPTPPCERSRSLPLDDLRP
jgi:NAD/NADP transhydrogenase alpha subunit